MSQKRLRNMTLVQPPPTIISSNPQPIFSFNPKKPLPTPPSRASPQTPPTHLGHSHSNSRINAIHPPRRRLPWAAWRWGRSLLQRCGRSTRPVADANVGRKRYWKVKRLNRKILLKKCICEHIRDPSQIVEPESLGPCKKSVFLPRAVIASLCFKLHPFS